MLFSMFSVFLVASRVGHSLFQAGPCCGMVVSDGFLAPEGFGVRDFGFLLWGSLQRMPQLSGGSGARMPKILLGVEVSQSSTPKP